MSDPFRLRVLKALTATLEGVTVANGYSHDLEGKVFRGRMVFGDDEPLPLVSILEPPIPEEATLSKGTNPYQEIDWDLLIQGFVTDDSKNPTDPAHVLMADVKKALIIEKRKPRGDNYFGLGDGVTEIHVGGGSVRPADEMSSRAFFWLTLRLKIVENLLDPYA